MADVKELGGVIWLVGFVEKEVSQFVSYCRELGTASCGDTVEEAIDNLWDAVDVHIEALIETGELLNYLREKNIRIEIEPGLDEPSIRVPPKKLFATYPRPVPVTAK
jgi:predicted RNase H-like HicB family nuclease